MAKQILTDLNLKGNELQKAVIENATTAPLNPSTGQIYYDTNLGKTKLFNGTTWTDDDKVYVGTIEPTDPGKTVWIDPSVTEISAEDVIFEDDENLEDKMVTKQDILTSDNAGDGIEITTSATTGKPIISNTRTSGADCDNTTIKKNLEDKIYVNIDNETIVYDSENDYIKAIGGSVDSKVEDVQINGTSIVSNKIANITSIPENTSDLNNDSGFITNTTTNFTITNTLTLDGINLKVVRVSTW